MPALEMMPTPFDPTIDTLSSKIQEIRERKARQTGSTVEASMDDAVEMVGSNLGHQEAKAAGEAVQGLSMEMVQQGADAHFLDPDVVASLIADPFDE